MKEVNSKTKDFHWLIFSENEKTNINYCN